MSGETVGAVIVLADAFIFGALYGLYLNVTHMHRMRAWACKVADQVELVRERVQM